MNNFQKEEEKAILEWCLSRVNILEDGGVWGIPRSGLAFRINKKQKKLILVAGNHSEEFEATRYWFAKIGWKVEKYPDFEVKNAAS